MSFRKFFFRANEMFRLQAKEELTLINAFVLAQGGKEAEKSLRDLSARAYGKKTVDKHESKLKQAKRSVGRFFSALAGRKK